MLNQASASFDDRETASNELNALIAKRFAEAGVAIDYDQLDVRIIAPAAGAPPLDVARGAADA